MLVLDEVGTKDDIASDEPTLKTRSLPAWVRSKPRPLSTEDDINDLYAKVTLYVENNTLNQLIKNLWYYLLYY